jgi:hypothetical protein
MPSRFPLAPSLMGSGVKIKIKKGASQLLGIEDLPLDCSNWNLSQ